MPIKLKSLAPKTPEKLPIGSRSAKETFRRFVECATSPNHCEDPFWGELRQKTTPNKFETVPQMFARWRTLAGINSSGSQNPPLIEATEPNSLNKP
jgi:hypothetical protein